MTLKNLLPDGAAPRRAQRLTSVPPAAIIPGMTQKHYPLMAMALLILATLACNLANDPAPIVVTATPSNQALIEGSTPTVPYVTPTPHIVPTPTLPPDVALHDARQALHNGDYVTAVELYQDVIDQPDSEPDMRQAATYGLGEAALREGLYGQAVAGLTQFITQYPDHADIPRAYFLRGEAYMGISEWSLAKDDFNTYLERRPGLIDSYAYELIGDCYLNLGEPQQSLDYYARAAEATRAVRPLVALRERVAAGYLNAGQPQDAVAQYDAILAVAQNPPYRASISLQAAQVLLGAEDYAGAYNRLQVIVRDYPATNAAYQALELLINAELQIDRYQAGLITYYNENYTAAIEWFNAHVSDLGYAPAGLLLMLGRAYRAVGNSQAALQTFQTVLDSYPEDAAFGEAWLEKGRTYFLAGDIPTAIQTYTALATEHPDVADGAEALWRAGYLYSTQGDTANALATFDILGRTYPGTEWAMDGLFLGATAAYNSGDLATAANLFGQLAQTGSGELQASAYLWVGQLYQLDGKDDLARAAYEAAATADPGGYYSIRADDLLNGRAPFTPPDAVQFEFDDAAQLAEAESWLRATFAIEQTGALYPLGETLKADPRVVRGTELAALNRYEDAEEEFEALRQAMVDDPLATYQLAIYLRDLGIYRLSITAAATLIQDAGVSTYDAPPYIARLRFPTYYQDLVIPNAEKNNLDPLLVFALIRQESLFEGFATSVAVAQGLMQIIPATGEEIAGRLGWPPDYQNSDVYRPYVNVRFGTYYLRWVLDLVDNIPYAALAGYNGGPGNAQQWLSISGPDIDLFIETVTFDETQRYVRRIYEQYSVYRALYGVEA